MTNDEKKFILLLSGFHHELVNYDIIGYKADYFRFPNKTGNRFTLETAWSYYEQGIYDVI